MIITASALALAFLARHSQTPGGAREVGEPATDVLVVSVRHDRKFVESRLSSVGLDATSLRKSIAPLDYEFVNEGSLWLAVDRAIFGHLPGMVEARATDFFSRRGYKPCKVSELPDGVRQAARQRIASISPNLTQEQIESTETSVEPVAWLNIRPPAGMGESRQQRIDPPAEALPKVGSRSALPEFPSGDVEGRAADLRLFVVGDKRESSALAMWDVLRPKMREIEKKYSDLAFTSSNPGAVAARAWMEKKLGARKGEEAAYGSLSAEAKKFLVQQTGRSQSDLEGAKVTVLPGGYQFAYKNGPSGRIRMPLQYFASTPQSYKPKS